MTHPRRYESLGADAASTGRSGTLMIWPEKLLAGIAYHLIDQGRAVGLDDHAARKTLDRLHRQQFTAYVPRVIWESMSDRERLDWMLSVSDTLFVLRADRVAVLKRRRS